MLELTQGNSESHKLCSVAKLLVQLLNCSRTSVFLFVQWEFHHLTHRSKDYMREWI